MIYATIKDAKIDKFGTLAQVFPNVSFPQTGVDPEWLKFANAQEVIMTLDHDETKQKVVPCDPYIGKDAKIYGVKIVDYTADEAKAYADAIKADTLLSGGTTSVK
jgi:hypothetical protein